MKRNSIVILTVAALVALMNRTAVAGPLATLHQRMYSASIGQANDPNAVALRPLIGSITNGSDPTRHPGTGPVATTPSGAQTSMGNRSDRAANTPNSLGFSGPTL